MSGGTGQPRQGYGMTFYQFIRGCFLWDAARTHPPDDLIGKVMKRLRSIIAEGGYPARPGLPGGAPAEPEETDR